MTPWPSSVFEVADTTTATGRHLAIPENTLPTNWHDDIMRFLPDAANQVVSLTIAGNAPGHLWSAWPQLGVTALWAAALVGVGAFLFRTRDA